MENELEKLLKCEVGSVFNQIGGNPFGLLFSGGVDSSLVAKIIDNIQPPQKGYLFSLVSENSKDTPFVNSWREFLNPAIWEFVPVQIPERKHLEKVTSEVNEILRKVFANENNNRIIFHANGNLTNMQISLACGLYLICEKAKSRGVRHLFSGQGSDELFGGYNKFKQADENSFLQFSKDEFNRLENVDKLRDESVSIHFDIILNTPFTSKLVQNFAFNLPVNEKIIFNKRINTLSSYNQEIADNKIIVRKLAKKLKIPENIVLRPKSAFQYSTNLQKILISSNILTVR